MTLKPVKDLAYLPTYGFGQRALLFWGTMGFMVIEGLGFVLAIGTYLYLQGVSDVWPLDPPPGLKWSSLLTALMLLSEIPNTWTKRAALKEQLGTVRIGVTIMALIGLACLGLRAMEFTTLNCRWDSNAYGSILWVLLGLHTTHLITDVFETCVMVPLLWFGPIEGRRFVDAEENQSYWDFVVLAWLPVWVTLYWLPRWLGSG
jgi:cytochrome c oxidase subunit I+III